MTKRPVLQFKIILCDIKPEIWRRIQISDLCSFWNLHVAIQDAMGWSDCHLHQFEVQDPMEGGERYIGIPTDDDFTLPGWDHKVKEYLSANKKFTYTYDFGDNWDHLIVYEGLQDKQANCKYPVCIDGRRACPPEDVGGTHGYAEFLSAISNPKHEDHEQMVEWIGHEFCPDEFKPSNVVFDNPKKRFEEAFEYGMIQV